jgi:hypothetical protein
MKFINIDQHIAVIEDMRHIFNGLGKGHKIAQFSLSGHAPIIGRENVNIPLLTGDKWIETVKSSRNEFYEKYKNFFSQADGFICCYPPIFAMLYERWEKPIIVNIPIRYEYGAEGNSQLWDEFNTFLKRDNVYLVANSLYDKKYTENFIDKEVEYIPSYCGYTGMTYNPVDSRFIYYSSLKVDDSSGRLVRKHDVLRAGHAWQRVAEFSGVVHIPYNISTMSIFEQYAANIPLYFPTKRFLLEMKLLGIPVLDQISFNIQAKLPPKSAITGSNKYDPNQHDDVNVLNYWLDFADFYNKDEFPYIKYFDSEKELESFLNDEGQEERDRTSQLMQIANAVRRDRINKKWDALLTKINGGQV